ncbi:MAG: CDP-glycerol glycerophosphotransferase family protein [Clostridia bacterium]|nr:CDP-glycerol glycerophosphotransferase family protein [Clostridia bacterium]
MSIRKLISYIGCLIKYAAAFAVAPFIKNKTRNKDLWIIAERGIDARDNAYHLFKYIRKTHPEINISYIITKNSSDRKNVEEPGRIIDFGSFEHFLAMAISKVKISTHIMGYSPNINLFVHLDKLGLVKGKKIFLQHGIIKDNLTYLYYNNTGLDLFVCSAKPEIDYIRENYGYPDGVLQMLGLCRYDYLEKNEKKTNKILLMPTWRVALQNCTEKEFCSSMYFKKYQHLLNSNKLEEILEKYNYELIFYPHIEVQKFLDCFTTDKKHIKIMGFKDSTVQDLLIYSDILITDFSSVFFDYGYMEKPMIFYQFDKEAFRKNHYGEGYFKYERDGFGEVVTEEEDVIFQLCRIIENGSKPEEIYLDRIHKFFTVRDENNCKRNFEAIYDIAGGKCNEKGKHNNSRI